MQVMPRTLTVVIGATGAGKSGLLLSLIGGCFERERENVCFYLISGCLDKEGKYAFGLYLCVCSSYL